MAKSPVQRQQRQWLSLYDEKNLSPGTANGVLLMQDDVLTLNVRSRLLRVLLTVSIVTQNYPMASYGVAGIGLIRADQSLSTASLNPLSPIDANKRWLWRQRYNLPGAPTGTYTGDVAAVLPYQPYHLDWQVYGGRGCSLDKDEGLYLTMSYINGTGPADNFYVRFWADMLWSV